MPDNSKMDKERRDAINVQDTNGNWVFITPVLNLVLTKEIKHEFTLNRVTFIEKNRLFRIEKRLKLQQDLKKGYFKPFWDSSSTFAFIRQNGKPSQVVHECFRLVNEEASILRSSFLGYAKRSSHRGMGIAGYYSTGIRSHWFLNTHNLSICGSSCITPNMIPLALDRGWRAFRKYSFFSQLMNIFNRTIQVNDSWRQDLWRVAVLIGQSLNSYDIPSAFLMNIIALETLLTNRDDKITEALPERVEAFLGWVGYWSQNNFDEQIRKVYKLRCQYVHSGNSDGISQKDLLFTDDLLFNLLVNITSHLRLFASKEGVVEFSRRVQAEQLLGIKPKVRPTNMRFFNRNYTQKDLQAW